MTYISAKELAHLRVAPLPTSPDGLRPSKTFTNAKRIEAAIRNGIYPDALPFLQATTNKHAVTGDLNFDKYEVIKILMTHFAEAGVPLRNPETGKECKPGELKRDVTTALNACGIGRSQRIKAAQQIANQTDPTGTNG